MNISTHVRVSSAIRGCLASLALVLAAPLAAQAPARSAAPALPAGVTAGASVEGIAEYRLANGLRVLLVPDSSKPSTTVNLTIHVGSRHENYGETGMAHLLEHLIFKGTPTHKNVWSEFTKRGLRANGSTWVDRTNYFASFAANDDNLRWYLGWLADAMVNSFIAKSDLDTEMTVVRNEMEMGENNPGGILFQRLLGAMYDWHAYGRSTIGARADVENVSIERLQAFYRLHYQPDNATLIVAGRFDPAAVLATVQAQFGAIAKPTRVLPPTYTLDPAQDGERVVTVRRVGGVPILYAGFHVPPGSHPDSAAATLLASALADAPGGRLHKRLVENKLAASSFGAGLSFAEPGLIVVGLQLAPGQDPAKARSEMLAVIEGVAKEPITAEEIERARVQWLNAWEQGFNDPESVGVQLSEAIALGDWRLYFLKRDHARKATLADVNRVAAERLRADNRTLAVYLPTPQPQRAPAPARVDVAALVKGYTGDAQAAQAEDFEATPANIESRSQRSTLAGGLKVHLVPKGTRGRAVQGQLQLHFGTVESLKGQMAVGALVGAILDHGAGRGANALSRQQIKDRFDRLRAQVGFQATPQGVSVGFETVREHVPAVIELIGQVLREPTLPASGLDEARRQWLANLEEQRKEPEALVWQALNRHGNPYPAGDLRYSATFEEQQKMIETATLPQLQAFHRRFYSAAVGEFSAVGDLDPVAVNAALAKAFGGWKQAAGGGSAGYTRAPRPLVAVKAQSFTIETPDKQNATLLATLALPLNDNHPDYAAFVVANRAFGSGGNSRLWKRIREGEGLSYDVRAYIEPNRIEANSRWVSSAIFAPQNRPKVEAAWRDELAKALKDGFTKAEIDEAKNGLLNARRLALAQDGFVVGEAQALGHLGRRFDFFQGLNDRIAAVGPEQANAAWRKYMNADAVSLAWGGDFAKKAP
jgi:zinc protease